MYTRCPSIANIFQKAVLLRDAKCNKIIQRQMRSEPFFKFSKIESKLKPMKRCFSGASNNRNSMHKTRNFQGVGLVRKSIPKFSREMVQQQSMREKVPPNQTHNNQVIVGNPGISVNTQSSTENKQKSGKITIVIDKNEICNCSAPNEDVQIYVTTTPETTQRRRLIKALSEADITEVSSKKCNCCTQCEEVKNSKIEITSPVIPNRTTLQQPTNVKNFSNNFPMRQQNVYGLPIRNFTILDVGRPSRMEMLRSRSMSDFPVIRKMIVPNNFHQKQSFVGQLPANMQRSPVYGEHIQGRLNSSGRHNSNQPPTNQGTMGPNISKMQIQPEHFSTPKVILLSDHQTKSCGIFPRANEQMKSHPVDVLQVERNRRINEFNRQLRKYSSFHQNAVVANVPPNKSDAKQSKKPQNGQDVGRSGSKFEKRSQQPQPKRITERVLRPATFSSVDGVIGNDIALNQRAKSAIVSNKNRSDFNLLRGSFVKQPLFFNSQETITKNRFPAEGASAPRTLTFQSQNANNSAAWAHKISKNMSQVRSRTDLMGNVNRVNHLTKHNTTFQPVTIPLKQRRCTEMLRANSLLPQSQLFVQRQPPLMVLKNRSEPSFKPTHQIENFQSPNVSYQANLKKLYPMNGIAMLMRTNPLYNFVQKGQPPQFLLKKKLPPMHRRPMPMRGNIINNFVSGRQPPQYFLKQKRAPQPAINRLRPTNFQPPMRQRSSFIPLPQKNESFHRSYIRNSLHREQPKLVPNFQKLSKPTQASMIPVRMNRIAVRHLPRSELSQQKATPLTKIPIVPFNSLMNSTQGNKYPQPQTNRWNVLDTRQQQKSIRINQRRKRNDVRRDQLQSSLPVTVMNQTNQIAKYVEKPKSVQPFGRPYFNETSRNPLRQMPQHAQMTSSTNGRKLPQKASKNPLRQMPQLRQMTPTDGQKSSPKERLTQPDQLKEFSPNSRQMTAIAPIVENSNNLRNNNPAVLFFAPGKLKLVNIPVPRLSDEKGVIVKMLYVHLTDADAQILSAVQEGPYKLTQPTIAGKSGSGLVVDVGKQVENVKIGDKVSVKGISCGKCTACANDNEVICERVPIVEKLGILKRFHAVPAKFVTKLPDAVHPIDGAMIDELSCSIRACKKSTLTAGDNVLVLGGKSLGLWTALAAMSMGATNVCLADSSPLMLEQAKKLGIKRVFLIKADSPVPNISKTIAEYMEGENPRIVFDCNGSTLTNAIAINTSQIGGKVVFMKNTISNQPIFLTDAVDRGIDILSSQHGNNDSERAAIQFLSSGKVQLKGIDSSFFNILNVHEAFGLLTSGTVSNIFIQPSRLDDAKKKSKIS